MSRRILLTGISGSIGVHFLAHFMHNTDWDVMGIDSFRHKGWSERLLEVSKDHPDWNDRWSVHTHDLTAPFSPLLKERLGKIDYIISMASLSDVEASIQNPVPFIQNNVNLTINLLEYAREIKPEVLYRSLPMKFTGPFRVNMMICDENGTPLCRRTLMLPAKPAKKLSLLVTGGHTEYRLL